MFPTMTFESTIKQPTIVRHTPLCSHRVQFHSLAVVRRETRLFTQTKHVDLRTVSLEEIAPRQNPIISELKPI